MNVFEKTKEGITPFLTTDYDLIELAQSLLHILPITVLHEWVKGHYTGDQKEFKHTLNQPRLTRKQKITMAKLIHGLANTNRQNHLYYNTANLCPSFNVEEETFENALTSWHPTTCTF
jgi:hypothetical protein